MSRSWLPELVVIALASGCIRVETFVQAGSAPDDLVVFDAPVPELPASLPLYRLASAPVLLQNAAHSHAAAYAANSDRKAPQFPVTCENLPADERSRCRFDAASGDLELYPDFAALADQKEAPRLDPVTGFERAKRFLESDSAVPRDEQTSISVEQSKVLQHVRVRRSDASMSGALNHFVTELEYVRATRRVGGLNVDGPGSRAMVVIGAQAEPQGYLRAWKAVASASEVHTELNPYRIRAEIRRELLQARPLTPAHVQEVTLAYYDGHRELLQPVVRYVVEFSRSHSTLGHAEHSIGYIPYAKTSESIPDFSDEKALAPIDVSKLRSASNGSQADAVNIGMYVVRNDRSGWLSDANAFWHALDMSNSGIPFVQSQFLHAVPVEFTSQKNVYVNAVDIALVEAHGRPATFATLHNSADFVFIGSDELPGYGSDAGGRLRHWILHSCDVIPAPPDTPNWADSWWPVFHGLRSVLGYRTSMYITDGAGAVFGKSLAANAPIVSAWFFAVASLNAYGIDPYGHFRCDANRPMGWPSAVSACGATNASAAGDDASAIVPDCLDGWWMSDSPDGR